MGFLILKSAILPFVPAPNIPNNLQSRIMMQTLCALSENECLFFEAALMALEKELYLEGKENDAIRVVIYIIDKNEFTLCIKSLMTAGLHANIIVLPVNRWRVNGYSQEKWIETILHELCHCFWLLIDEELVDQKVHDICKFLDDKNACDVERY
jgi:hypothetical protein